MVALIGASVSGKSTLLRHAAGLVAGGHKGGRVTALGNTIQASGRIAALLRQPRNRPVLVTFFASWCPPCTAEFRELNKLRDAFPPDRLNIIAINLYEDYAADPDGRRMNRFLKRTNPAFPLVHNGDTAQMERLFEPFYRGRAAVLGRVGGTGIGLTIAREYARAHDGHLTILDVPRGAAVELRLPAAPE